MTVSFVIILLIGLPCLELFLRAFTHPPFSPGYLITNPTRHYELRPGFLGHTYGAALKINSYGFRGDDGPLPLGPETYRIAIYGDSLAFSQGVEADEAFPKQLEHELNSSAQRPLGIKDFYVYNLATPGYNTADEWDDLKSSFSRFRPNLIVIQFTLDQSTFYVPPKTVNQVELIRSLKDKLRYLYVYDFLGQRLFKFQHKLARHETQKTSPLAGLEPLYADDYPGWIECQKSIRSIAQFAKSKKVPVLFALFEETDRIAPTIEADPKLPILKKIIATLKENGISYIWVAHDALRKYSGQERGLQISASDGHLSLTAHRLIADGLFRYILENRVVPWKPTTLRD